MGKPTGFMEWDRALPPKRDERTRLGDYNEVYEPQPAEDTQQQAGRCMDCGVPFCMQGCPLGNQIPEWNDLVFRDRWKRAWIRLASTNNFPEFTGRLCPAPCEGACTLAINQPAVTIEFVEKAIIERAFEEGWVAARPPLQRTGKTVAVIGSGPAGLAAAAQLNQAGHLVTVYERADRVGGLLRYGIPDFKMEKWVIDRRLALMAEEGVVFETGVDVGGDISWTGLRQAHDALVITTGARRARDLRVPGRVLNGVHLAMDYLTASNGQQAGDGPVSPAFNAKDKRVIILGGGDTGSDCLGTALRQGATSVLQVELFDAPPKERADGNPWPQWPVVFRTSTSHKEGGKRAFSLMTTHLGGADGKLERLHAVQVGMVDGRLEQVAGTEQIFEVDLLLLAMGFTGPETDSLSEQLGVAIDERGRVAAGPDFATSVPGVYCAGDAKRGASLIVWAISEGREAARHVDAYLMQAPPRLPTRGSDLPFGGR